MKSVTTVPLKKVCSEAGIDPRTARRILREDQERPSGRWAWPQSKVPAIIRLLKKEAPNAPTKK